MITSLKGSKIVLMKSDGKDGTFFQPKKNSFTFGKSLFTDIRIRDSAQIKKIHCKVLLDKTGVVSI